MPMLAKVIHRAARLQHLQRLVAFRAAGLKGKYPFALGAMRATASVSYTHLTLPTKLEV